MLSRRESGDECTPVAAARVEGSTTTFRRCGARCTFALRGRVDEGLCEGGLRGSEEELALDVAEMSLVEGDAA